MLDKNERSFLLYNNAIKTELTREIYVPILNKFMEFSKQTSYDEVVKLPQEEIQKYLEDFVMSLRNFAHNTVRLNLSAVLLFFDMNDKLYNKRKLQKLLPANNKKLAREKPFTTEEIKRMLETTKSLRTKAIIHYTSTGARPATIWDPSSKNETSS